MMGINYLFKVLSLNPNSIYESVHVHHWFDFEFPASHCLKPHPSTLLMKPSSTCITIYRGLPKSKNCWLPTPSRSGEIQTKTVTKANLKVSFSVLFPIDNTFCLFSQETTTSLALLTSSYLITAPQKRIAFARGPSSLTMT